MRNYKNALKHIKEPIQQLNETHLATKKIELGVMDDLNKLQKPSQELIKQIEENNRILSINKKSLGEAFKDYQRAEKNKEKLEAKYFKLKREYLSTEQEYQRAENAFKSYGRSMKDYQKNIERFENKNKPLIKSAQKNITAFDKLIAQAEKAAKDLGVKIPTASFSKLRDRLRKFI